MTALPHYPKGWGGKQIVYSEISGAVGALVQAVWGGAQLDGPGRALPGNPRTRLVDKRQTGGPAYFLM